MAAGEEDESVWGFVPNRVAPIVFAVLFTASACWHIWLSQHYHSWKMTLLLPWGAMFYIAGLATREAGAFFPGNDGLFVASRVLTLDATAVAAAANYFILGRTLYYIPWASPIDPRRATQIFIFLDWLIGIFVAVGLTHIYKDSRSDARLGRAFVRASLILQVVLYTFYLAILGIWHRRILKAKVQRPPNPWYLLALHACGVLILIRCIYRTIEYFQGATGYLAVREVYYYIFDALAILGMSLLLNIFHPGKFFPEDGSIYLATDGLTEVKGPGWSDERRWYWATLDPLGLADCFKAGRKKPKFWESEGTQGFVRLSDSRRTSA